MMLQYYVQTITFYETVVPNKQTFHLFITLLSSPEVNQYFEVLANRVSNNTGLTEQLLELKFSGCKSPFVSQENYKTLPLFKMTVIFEEFLQKSPNDSSSNKWWPSSTAAKIFFYWWNKIYGKHSDASRRQSGYDTTFTKARHDTPNYEHNDPGHAYRRWAQARRDMEEHAERAQADQERRDRNDAPEDLDRNQPDLQRGPQEFLHYIARERYENRHDLEYLAEMDAVIARLLYVGEDGEDGE